MEYEAFVKEFLGEASVRRERCEKDLKGKLVDRLKTVPIREGGNCDLEEIEDYLIAYGVEIPTRCKGKTAKGHDHMVMPFLVRPVDAHSIAYQLIVQVCFYIFVNRWLIRSIDQRSIWLGKLNLQKENKSGSSGAEEGSAPKPLQLTLGTHHRCDSPLLL